MQHEVIAEKPAGGYLSVGLGQLEAAWRAYREKRLALADLRVYFAALELIARRCGKPAVVDLGELSGLAGTRVRGASLRKLVALGVLASDGPALGQGRRAGRCVPVPRRILRYLARCHRPSTIACVLVHLGRCLRLRRVGERRWVCVSGGLVKSRDHAREHGVDLRRFKAARAELVRIGWLERVAVPAWVERRHGGCYRIRFEWGEGQGQEGAVGVAAEAAVLPPRPGESAGQVATPKENGNLPPGANNHEPSLRGVSIEDLRETGRTLLLHEQAVRLGLADGSEAGRLRVVAAAEHALAVATRNAPGLFAAIVRRGLYRYVTADDEDAARRRLREHLYPAGWSGGQAAPVTPPHPQAVIDQPDVALARQLRVEAAKVGYRGDLFPLVQPRGWTRARWEAAIAPR